MAGLVPGATGTLHGHSPGLEMGLGMGWGW